MVRHGSLRFCPHRKLDLFYRYCNRFESIVENETRGDSPAARPRRSSAPLQTGGAYPPDDRRHEADRNERTLILKREPIGSIKDIDVRARAAHSISVLAPGPGKNRRANLQQSWRIATPHCSGFILA
jgi:hypothetical protein